MINDSVRLNRDDSKRLSDTSEKSSVRSDADLH